MEMEQQHNRAASWNAAAAAEDSRASELRGLYRAGGIAALLAGVVFRRNLAAEVSLFNAAPVPENVEGWFHLLQTDRLLGLAYLNFFDIIDCALVGLMFLALYAALRRARQGTMIVAAAAGLAGAVVYFASNPAFTMVALSEQYAAASTVSSEAQRTTLLAAGQAVLAMGRLGTGYPGMGVYLSLLLLAVAGLLAGVVMLRSGIFGRVTAWVGILAGVVDLVYCLAFANAPGLTMYLMAAAGLLWMVWHVLVGVRLCKFSGADDAVGTQRDQWGVPCRQGATRD